MPQPQDQGVQDRGSRLPQLWQRFEGVMALLLTPFDESLSIDWSRYEAYVDWQLEHQPHGLFAVCGTSEMKWLTLDERLRLARVAAQRAAGTPVLATANLNLDWSTHVDELRAMEETGVAGVVLIPPDGMGTDPRRLEDHFATLAQAAHVPVFLYEWPQVSPYFLDPDAFGRLVRHHAVAGIKDTTCTAEGIAQKITAAPDAVVYQANTPFLPEAVEAGARGIMAITSAACADLNVHFWRAANEDLSGVRTQRLHAHLVHLDAILRQAHPILAKHLMRLRGFDFPLLTRWPVTAPAESVRALAVWYADFEDRGHDLGLRA